MIDLQVPLLAAKALLLLLLFAFVYAVVRRGVGDLRSIPENEEFGEPAAESGPRWESPIGEATGVSELVVEDSDVLAPGTRYPIMSGVTTLGRSTANDIILKNDDYVSGTHARLTRHGGLLYVEDSNSTNGTYVNGKRAVGATPLRAGDIVRIGSTSFRFTE